MKDLSISTVVNLAASMNVAMAAQKWKSAYECANKIEDDPFPHVRCMTEAAMQRDLRVH